MHGERSRTAHDWCRMRHRHESLPPRIPAAMPTRLPRLEPAPAPPRAPRPPAEPPKPPELPTPFPTYPPYGDARTAAKDRPVVGPYARGLPFDVNPLPPPP
mmetsp:Transcript_25006/g.48858  ORF Transcript_25006/g.48858 Transcript_25006/m.48858 type:complete len:101 (-) Transcript_25006:352-654(-)